MKREGAAYFVTFRLADSLPREALLKLQRARDDRLQQLRQGVKSSLLDATVAANRSFRRDLEKYLDSGVGQCHLRRPEIASVVGKALLFFQGERYQLEEWVVMPNHVHVVLWPAPNFVLSEILKSWKQFTGRSATKLLQLETGRFWQPESYDHWIRNDEERARIRRYIRNNPVTAGLCSQPEDWLWSSANTHTRYL